MRRLGHIDVCGAPEVAAATVVMVVMWVVVVERVWWLDVKRQSRTN